MLPGEMMLLNMFGPATEPYLGGPRIYVDRGGAGPSWPGYDIVDIMGALNSFRERPGEHPVARAARRHAHVGEHLGALKQARENREAVAFLAGATLATVESAERFEAMRRLQVSELVEILDSVRGTSVPAPAEPIAYERGGSRSGVGFGPALFIGGIMLIRLSLKSAPSLRPRTRSAAARSNRSRVEHLELQALIDSVL